MMPNSATFVGGTYDGHTTDLELAAPMVRRPVFAAREAVWDEDEDRYYWAYPVEVYKLTEREPLTYGYSHTEPPK